MTNIVHFSGLKVKIVKCDHSLSHTLFGTQQKCDKIHRPTLFWFAEWNSSLWLFSVPYSIWHAAQLNLTYIVHFFGLQSKKVKFDHSLSHTLFGTQQKFDIHHRFFKFTKWKKSTLIILCLVLYPARSRNVTYIIHFWSFTLPRNLFGTQQKCDFRTVFGLQSEKSQVWSFSVSNSTQHAAKIGHTSLIFFRFRDWKSSSLINLYLVLDSARAWIATNVLS